MEVCKLNATLKRTIVIRALPPTQTLGLIEHIENGPMCNLLAMHKNYSNPWTNPRAVECYSNILSNYMVIVHGA